MLHVDQFDLGTGKIMRGRDDLKPGNGRLDRRVGNRRLTDQDGVAISSAISAPNAETSRRVALWIEINHQNALFAGGHGRREVYGGRRFADPAFLVDHRKNTGSHYRQLGCVRHGSLPPTEARSHGYHYDLEPS